MPKFWHETTRPVRLLLVVSVVLLVTGPVLMAWPGQPATTAPAAAAPLPELHGVPRPVEAPMPAPECADAPALAMIVIPDLCLRAPIETTTVRRGQLELPLDADRVYRWDGGAVLDAPRGTTLLAAHVRVGKLGEGPFGDLARIRPGDLIETRSRRGRLVRWRAVEATAYSRVALPDEVWAGPGGPRRLVLVTCGGPVLPDGSGFRDNVVVTAVPATA